MLSTAHCLVVYQCLCIRAQGPKIWSCSCSSFSMYLLFYNRILILKLVKYLLKEKRKELQFWGPQYIANTAFYNWLPKLELCCVHLSVEFKSNFFFNMFIKYILKIHLMMHKKSLFTNLHFHTLMK